MSTRDEAISSVLQRAGTTRRLSAGEVLHAAGARFDAVFVVTRGELVSALDGSGGEAVEHWSAGDIMNLAAFITREHAETFVVAKMVAEVCAVDDTTFDSLVRHHEGFHRRVLEFVARRVTSLEAQSWRLARSERLFDPLTNAQSKRWFKQALPRFVARHEQEHEPLCALVLNLDRFKHFNDEFGFQAGDEALRVVAKTVRHSIRVNDRLVRVGGEEFVVLLASTTLDEGAVAAERVRASIASAPIRTMDTSLAPVTVSVGVACHVSGGELEAFVERARDAMYEAKKDGGNRVTVSSPPLR